MKSYDLDMTWYNKERNLEYPIYKESEDGEWVKHLEAKGLVEKNKKLQDALERSMSSLRTAMFGYKREANRMPNYDLAKSALWDIFLRSIEQSKEALEGINA